MDWIKKYNEKLLLAASLLFLIIVAGFLAMKITRLSKEIHNSLSTTTPTTKRVTLIDLTTYSNAISTLQSPTLWTNENPSLLFPPVLVNPITTNPPPTNVETQAVIRLTSITHRPFSLLFKSYRVDPSAKDGATDFQINFLTGNRTIFVKFIEHEIIYRDGVPLKDFKTGYFLAKFERKIVTKYEPSLSKEIDHDESLLTVQHEGEDPIVLVLGRVANHPRRYARIQCPDKAAPLELSIGDTFDFADKHYKVVDITEKEVLLINTKSGEKHTLPLTAP